MSPTIRELVENGQPRMIAAYLERIRDGIIHGDNERPRADPSQLTSTATRRSSSRFHGELEHVIFEGTNRLVLTDRRMYILVTIGPKGPTPNADVRRFLDSFRLVGTKPASARNRTRATAPPTSMLATKLAGPMLAVARLVTETKLSAKIDQVLQNIPAAERLGPRWNSCTRRGNSRARLSPAGSTGSPTSTRARAHSSGTSTPNWRASRRDWRPTQLKPC